jgi:hypothetical protein
MLGVQGVKVDSSWCFISAKCVSSASARFLIYGAHTVCFCTLVTILDPPYLFFETRSHFVAQAVLKLAMLPRLALNSPSACLSLLSSGITGLYHHAGFHVIILKYNQYANWIFYILFLGNKSSNFGF